MGNLGSHCGARARSDTFGGPVFRPECAKGTRGRDRGGGHDSKIEFLLGRVERSEPPEGWRSEARMNGKP